MNNRVCAAFSHIRILIQVPICVKQRIRIPPFSCAVSEIMVVRVEFTFFHIRLLFKIPFPVEQWIHFLAMQEAAQPRHLPSIGPPGGRQPPRGAA